MSIENLINALVFNIIHYSRPDSPIRETAINISQQILPVNQLKVSPPSRDRSRSETELNMFEKSTVRIFFVDFNLTF